MNFFLSENDRELLQRLLAMSDADTVNSPQRTEPLFDDHQASDVYIARPQNEEGIPALQRAGTGTGTVAGEDVPGRGPCDVYTIISGVLRRVFTIYDVYNLSENDIPQDWITINRTKYGHWLVQSASMAARWGWTTDGFTSYEYIDVEIYNGQPPLGNTDGVGSGNFVTARAPGLDYPSRVPGILLRVQTIGSPADINGPFWQFWPLECPQEEYGTGTGT